MVLDRDLARSKRDRRETTDLSQLVRATLMPGDASSLEREMWIFGVLTKVQCQIKEHGSLPRVVGVTVLLDRGLSGLQPSDLFESGKVRLDGFSEFSDGRKVSFFLDCHVKLCNLLKDCLFKTIKDLLTREAHFLFS
jgi:hypothetical protein